MAAPATSVVAAGAAPGFGAAPVMSPQSNLMQARPQTTKTHAGAPASRAGSLRRSSTSASSRGSSAGKREVPAYLKDHGAAPSYVGGHLPGHARPLSHEATRRLILAETVAQKTVNNSVSRVLKAEEYRVHMYLDCGLLGIKPAEIRKSVMHGGTEENLVKKSYKRLKSNVRGSEDDGVITAGSLIDRYAKRPKISHDYARSGVYQLTEKHIEEAVLAIEG
eukprot:CAMPEP_0194028370 /NCGR_PEP_ID=MMETSP0009_2-20130614/2355_1 /TAXON_ID=210454 /ORGANISM="Grammatophora oceanica, Strain CCMP 410" /LENGTH=220 /DNA_ID=CAMNT_0038667741 /DNA_START=22 /DNA_END=684 /DNA_ORIENTATION=-